MKTLFISITVLFCQFTLFAQQLQQRNQNAVDLDSVNIDMCYDDKKLLLDEGPIFKRENSDFDSYIVSHLIYPEEARKELIEGNVYVSFVIDTNGKVKDVRIMYSSNSIFNQAATDVISHSPKWKPGTYKGKPVRVKKMARVKFVL